MPRLILFLLVFVCGLARPLGAETLADVDAVVARAPSLDSFLGDRALVDEYYIALRGYYGGEDKFPRASFDAIVAQLRELKDKVPDVGKRLWEPGEGEAFEVSSKTRTYGVVLQERAWTDYRDILQRRLAWKEGRVSPAAVKTRMAKLTEEEAALTARTSALPRAARESATRQFWEAAKANPEYREVAAYLVRQKLRTEEISDKFNTADADLVLDTMNELRQDVRGAFARDGIALGPFASLVQEEIPTVKEMLGNGAVFHTEMRSTNRGVDVPVGRGAKVTYRFSPLPRKLHGIFKGIPLKECVGGGVAADVTPERWATVALPGARIYHVEKIVDGEASYGGFVQHVPLKNARGEILASTDFGAPALRARELYAGWLTGMTKQMPKEWKGLAVGESNHIDNAGVLTSVRGSPSYLFGKPAERADALSHLDDTAQAIVASSPKSRYKYGGNMIFDGQDARARTLRLLDAEADARIRDPEYIRARASGSVAERGAFLEELDTLSSLPPETKTELAKHMDIPTVRAWMEARRRMKFQLQQSQMTGDPSLEKLYKGVRLLSYVVGAGAVAARLIEPSLADHSNGFLLGAGIAWLFTNPFRWYEIPRRYDLLRATDRANGPESKLVGAFRKCRAAIRSLTVRVQAD